MFQFSQQVAQNLQLVVQYLQVKLFGVHLLAFQLEMDVSVFSASALLNNWTHLCK